MAKKSNEKEIIFVDDMDEPTHTYYQLHSREQYVRQLALMKLAHEANVEWSK